MKFNCLPFDRLRCHFDIYCSVFSMLFGEGVREMKLWFIEKWQRKQRGFQFIMDDICQNFVIIYHTFSKVDKEKNDSKMNFKSKYIQILDVKWQIRRLRKPFEIYLLVAFKVNKLIAYLSRSKWNDNVRCRRIVTLA